MSCAEYATPGDSPALTYRKKARKRKKKDMDENKKNADSGIRNPHRY